MYKLIITMILLVMLGCKNTVKDAGQKKITDTIAVIEIESDTAKTDGVEIEKPIPSLEKSIPKDTIRDYEKTKMDEEFFQKAIIDLSDSSLIVYQNIRADYRIFGYQKPDTNSRKMVLFSVFTPDVEGNPYKCPYGSYYYSGAMHNTDIKYVKNVGDFVKVNLIKNKDSLLAPIYILKNWVQFETKN